MRRRGFQLFCVVLVAFGALTANAQSVPAPPSARPQPPPPLPPLTPSPVETFRMVLTTNEGGREAWLARKQASTRAAMEAKLREYAAMSAAEREARLQASQLRWYLPRLMKMKAPERTQVLAKIPQADRKLIEQRLGLWDILPPGLQTDILAQESAFLLIEAAGRQSAVSNTLAGLDAQQQQAVQRKFDVWNRMMEMPAAEQSKALAQLSDADRERMELSLSAFSKLSEEKRREALAGFKKFAELSAGDRAAFLKRAERWQAMSESERRLWRTIVARLQSPRPTPPIPQPRVGTAADNSSLIATNY
jgi:ureidoglycolate hydrolase